MPPGIKITINTREYMQCFRCRIDEDGVLLLHKVMLRFCDIERRVAAMFEWCENAILSAIGDLKMTSDVSSSSDEEGCDAAGSNNISEKNFKKAEYDEEKTTDNNYHDPADIV